MANCRPLVTGANRRAAHQFSWNMRMTVTTADGADSRTACTGISMHMSVT